MKEKKTKEQIICDAVCGLIMLLCVISYLLVGTFTGLWHPYWIIPACGGVICGVASLVVNTISSVKEINKQDKNIEE